jgi:Kelch motif
MFNNLGPSPSARSGHAMASVDGKVFVLGGHSAMPSKTEDHSVIHILDTSSFLLLGFMSFSQSFPEKYT